MILSERLQAFRQPETPFAFFDFDGTLTHSDTLMPFLHYISGTKYYAKLLKVSPILLGYLTKLIPNDAVKEYVLSEFIGGMDEKTLFQAASEFVSHKLPDLLLPAGIQKFQEHRQQGHYCVLVSASPELYLTEWARQQQFDGILGSRLALENHRFTGRLQGKNCFGIEKITRIEAEYGTECWADSFAYSDSRSDAPMLGKAAHGFLLGNGVFSSFQAA